MLNFREELNKIKEEKLTSCEAVKHQVDFCLEGVLDYLKKKRIEEFFKEIELRFVFGGSKIYVKEDPWGKAKEIYNFVFSNSETASEVLLHIEQKLLSEGFELSSKERAARDGSFSIKINV